MNRHVTEASQWLYQGLWSVLVRWFRVPSEPPQLPTLENEQIRSFRPAVGFLRYLKFQFWVILVIIDIGLLIAWLVISVAVPWLGLLITPLALALIIVPDVLAYIAIHLRYDTTWYVLSDRSIRIRRGIWIIRETTITFENIQNVTVDQGPLQRWFGISNVLVQTAGGGGAAAHGQEGAALMTGHNGLIEGVDNAAEIRDLILNRLKRTRSTGLGDDRAVADRPSVTGFSPAHMALLHEIRNAAVAAVAQSLRD